MKRGIPERGDVLDILHNRDLEPTRGRKQQGKRYVVVLTTRAGNTVLRFP